MKLRIEWRKDHGLGQPYDSVLALEGEVTPVGRYDAELSSALGYGILTAFGHGYGEVEFRLTSEAFTLERCRLSEAGHRSALTHMGSGPGAMP